MLKLVKIALCLLLGLMLAMAAARETNVDSLDKLKAAMNDPASPSRKLAFFSTANANSVRGLFSANTAFDYDVLADDARIQRGVLDGLYLAGSVSAVKAEERDRFNVISSGVVSAKAVFTLPDVSDEHPYGAGVDLSRRQFRAVLNLAIVQLQNEGADARLAAKYEQPVVDVRTCKLDAESADEYVVPNRAEAQGLLGRLLRGEETLRVGWYGEPNATVPRVSDDFALEYLGLMLAKVAELSGPDGVKYGALKHELVYAKSSTANLLRGRVHMTAPYFQVDNVYRGSRERCDSFIDCPKSFSDANGYEACVGQVCTSPAKPIGDVFKLSCFTFATETLFITKRVGGARGESNGPSGGTIAGFVVLALCLAASLALLGFVLFRERTGRPLMASQKQETASSAHNRNFNDAL